MKKILWMIGGIIIVFVLGVPIVRSFCDNTVMEILSNWLTIIGFIVFGSLLGFAYSPD